MALNIIQDKTTTFNQLVELNASQIRGVGLSPHIGNFERRHFVWMKQGPVHVYDFNDSIDDIYKPYQIETRELVRNIYSGSELLTPYAKVQVGDVDSNMAFFHYQSQSQLDAVKLANFSKSILLNEDVLKVFDVIFSNVKNRKLKTIFKHISADGYVSNSCPGGYASWMNHYIDSTQLISSATNQNTPINTDIIWAPNFLNVLSVSALSVNSSTSDVYLLSGRTMYNYVLGMASRLEKYWDLIATKMGFLPDLNVHLVAGTGMNLATESSEQDLCSLIDVYLETGCGFSDLKQMIVSRQPMSQYDYLSLGQPDLQLSELQRTVPLSVLSELEAMLKSN